MGGRNEQWDAVTWLELSVYDPEMPWLGLCRCLPWVASLTNMGSWSGVDFLGIFGADWE